MVKNYTDAGAIPSTALFRTRGTFYGTISTCSLLYGGHYDVFLASSFRTELLPLALCT